MDDRIGQIWIDEDGEIFLVIGLETEHCHPILWLYCIEEYIGDRARTIDLRSEFRLWESTEKKRVA